MGIQAFGPPPTLGVEEEFFLVDRHSRSVAAAATRVLTRVQPAAADCVSGEFTEYQVEGKTLPCSDSEELRGELTRVRAELAVAARAEGLRLCASGTPVLGGDGGRAELGTHPRYRAGARQYRGMLDDFAVCAFHAHVHLPDRETAVLVGNHLRPWLPLLVAMTANSPFHQGRDTGYASWRSVIRGRFPCLGPPPYAESLADHERIASAMAAAEVMLEPGLPFWDVRPNPRLPTLEVRVMDVLSDVRDTVAVTVLIRALVATAAQRVAAGDPGPRVGAELLRAAHWRAARDGWSGRGVDALTARVLPFSAQAYHLLELVRPALHAFGDEAEVAALLDRLALRGCGAQRQRALLGAGSDLGAVVDGLEHETWPGGESGGEPPGVRE